MTAQEELDELSKKLAKNHERLAFDVNAVVSLPPNVDYTIETLEIELHKIKNTLRIIDRNMHENVCDMPGREPNEKRLEELQKTINFLRSS